MICVNSVSVSPKSITMKVGSWCYDATASVSPANASCDEVYWRSENPSVASVNASSGHICANGVGTTRIYASATDGSGCKDYLTVTVSNTIPVTSVSLSRSTIRVQEKHTTSLTATVYPSNATTDSVVWTSSNNNVATVSNGIVEGISVGTATITATAADGSGKSASCTVSVTRDVLVSIISVSPSQKTLPTGKSQLFAVSVAPSNATKKSVVWSSDDPCVATVNSDTGLVLAQNPGTTIIRATALDGGGAVGTCSLTVVDPIYVENITPSKSHLVLHKGEGHRLTATICPTNATTKTIRWCSSNESVTTVNQYTGKVYAKGVGRAIVYVTAQDGSNAQAKCTVVVKQTVVCSVEETPTNKVKANTFADPVDVYTGAHLLNNTIMSLFGGQGLKLVAHYNSTELAAGTLGKGWYHNYEKYLEINDCDIYVYNTPSTFSRYTAQSHCSPTFTCCSADKKGYVLTVDYSRQYPYIIDCNSAKTEHYDVKGNLAKIVDHQGFETLISHSDSLITITDGVSGKKMYLEKDATCKIIRVYDDAERQATLTYSGDLLTAICDVNGNTLTYTYDEDKRVKSGTDSKGICYFENAYDVYGRVIDQKDAIPGSLKSTFAYDGNKRTTSNRNGKQSYREYNTSGMLIKHTDENGNSKTYEYDDSYNVTRETDANGNSVTKVYNSFNKPTQVTDRNGNKTYFTYDSKGNVTKIRYPAINGVIPEETFVYNSRNQMVQHTDIRGTVTVYTYDTNGMPATKKIGSKNPIVYSYQGGLLKSQTDAMGNTTRYTHNAIGQVISKTDADNKVTEYVYDKCGNLLRTVDANGKTVINTYDGNYQKTSVTDANGNKTEYSYNGNMKNDVVTLPDGHTVRYEFDGEDRTVRVTDQDNNITNVTYDDAGRVLSKRFADGAIVQYEYDAVGNVVKETNPKGAVITKTFDKLGNVLTVTDDEGNTTSYEYNAMSKVTRVTNAVAGTTVFVYSKAGDLLSETDALGNTKTYTYDAFGNRLTATDAKNNVTTYTYDQNNNLLTVRNALGHLTTYTYNCLNQCTSVKDARNNVIQYGYDALGRRTSITDPCGNVFTTSYDGNGNVVKTTDAKGNVISETVYNSLNQPLMVTDAMGKATTYTYNALGKVESVTDPLGHRSEFTYNSRGQNTSVRDAANNTSTSSYDLLGNVTRLAGPLGGATSYEYDDMGRLISESTTSGGTIQYTYNELSVRKKITNARGQIKQLFYDAMGRITGYTCPEGSVSYTYDANGNVLTVTDVNGTITRTYDALNRVTSYTDTYGNVIRYEYDAVGNLSKLIYPDNTAVSYAYDANNNLTRVTDWANRVTSYTYDANNRVIGVTKPDGSVTTTVYDNKQRVTSTVERTAGGVVITGFEYTYDDLSRIIEEKVLANSTKMCYTYDSLNRVTKRTIKNLSDDSIVSTETFNHDAAGNVTSAPNSTFQYDTNNRLVTFNNKDVSYDLDGNMLSNGSLTCTYDSANRLITAGGHTYTYNAENVRIRNLGDCCSGDTVYTYDSNCRLSKLLCKTTDGVTTKYVYGRGLIGEEVSNTFKTYHFDSRGSTIAITDSLGNITDTFAYDTYGKRVSHTGSNDIIFGYNGRDGVVTDKNGLIYMRARYYSPVMKRFINADIVAGGISNAITLNRFAYANGNPVSFVDPFGLTAERGIGFEWDVEITDIIGWGKDAVDIIRSAYYRWKYGFSVYKKGAYAIVKGARSFVTTNQGIQGTRYAFANASKYGNVFKYVSPKVAVKDALTGKGSIFGYAMVAVDTGLGIYENIQNGTRPQKIVSDAVVDAGLGVGSMALSAAAGAKIGALAGSVFPGLGNVIGAAGGALVGFGAYMLTDVVTINGKTGSEWIKEGAAVVADGLVDAGQWVADTAVDVWNEATEIVKDAGEWIADTASDVWDATTDFVEDAGEWIADTASDAWEATTDFFEDAGNAVGNFFSGLFSW